MLCLFHVFSELALHEAPEKKRDQPDEAEGFDPGAHSILNPCDSSGLTLLGTFPGVGATRFDLPGELVTACRLCRPTLCGRPACYSGAKLRATEALPSLNGMLVLAAVWGVITPLLVWPACVCTVRAHMSKDAG
jgi:hypothetical protein